MKQKAVSILTTALLIFAVLAVCIGAATLGRDEGKTSHVHSFRTVGTTATCTEGGIRTEMCVSCKQTRTTPEEARGHAFFDNACAICGLFLPAPSISLSGDILTITDESGLAEAFDILVDGEVVIMVSTNGTPVDLTTLGLTGTHSITARAKASGYADSAESEAVSYSVAQEHLLSGAWVFNETLSPMSGGASLQFSSGDTTYSAIRLVYTGDDSWEMQYRGSTTTVYRSGDGWSSNSYRIITFDGTQTVSQEFYEWFTANAEEKDYIPPHSGGSN